MILCLDVGNSQIFGGVFKDEKIVLKFRHNTSGNISSDQFGLFLRNVIRENDLDPKDINKISICTVVPQVLYTIRAACIKYFDCQPFILGPGTKTGLKINYRNPSEVGADRIANAIAAYERFPNKNLIVVDYGTATTFCAIKADRNYLGGVIMPGMRLMMEALEDKTAKLPSVEILRCSDVVGRSTVESIQSGLYFGHVFATRGVIDEITKKHFEDKPVVIGTGGFATLFQKEEIFDVIEPNLVLDGLYLAHKYNC